MRVALVTGAARGIGAATVEALCRQGYGVTALDLCSGGDVPAGVDYPFATAAELAAVAARWPDQVLPIEADVRDQEALHDAVEATLSQFGRLDATVAGAGVVVGGLPQWETPAEHLGTLLDINLRGVWNTAAAAVPSLLASRDPAGGRFVALASTAGDRGSSTSPATPSASTQSSGSCAGWPRTWSARE